MIPSARLLWLTVVLFPASVVAGLWPSFRLPAVVLGGCLAAAAAADACLSRNSLKSCEAALQGPVRLHKDRQGEIALLCRTDRTMARLRVGLAFPAGIEADQDAQEAVAGSTGDVVVRWKVTPRRRGDFVLGHAYVECASRGALWDVRRACPLGETVQVFPNLQGRDELLAIRLRMAGGRPRRLLGRGREFEHLREYVTGDGLDEIDWKATARRGKPITRVFQVERTQEIYAIVDASRLTGRMAGAETRLERYIQAALTLSAAAQSQGDHFGMAAFTDRVLSFVRARRSGSQLSLCRQAVYRLQPAPVAPDFEDVAAHIQVRLRNRSLLIFLTDLDEPSAAGGFARGAQLLARKHVVAAITIRPAGAEPLFTREAASFDEVRGQVAGHLQWKRLQETGRDLRRFGVQFRLAEEPALSRQLASLYDEIKQRQLL